MHGCIASRFRRALKTVAERPSYRSYSMQISAGSSSAPAVSHRFGRGHSGHSNASYSGCASSASKSSKLCHGDGASDRTTRAPFRSVSGRLLAFGLGIFALSLSRSSSAAGRALPLCCCRRAVLASQLGWPANSCMLVPTRTVVKLIRSKINLIIQHKIKNLNLLVDSIMILKQNKFKLTQQH